MYTYSPIHEKANVRLGIPSDALDGFVAQVSFPSDLRSILDLVSGQARLQLALMLES